MVANVTVCTSAAERRGGRGGGGGGCFKVLLLGCWLCPALFEVFSFGVLINKN